jgi:hypothetical protein
MEQERERNASDKNLEMKLNEGRGGGGGEEEEEEEEEHEETTWGKEKNTRFIF